MRNRLLSPSAPLPLGWPLLAAFLLTLAGACDSKSRGEDQTPGSTDSERRTARTNILDSGVSQTASADRTKPPPEAPQPGALDRYTSDIDGSGDLIARIITSEGTVHCKLFGKRAPITVANFVGLARGHKEWVDPQTGSILEEKPFYDGVEFHRVIPGFVIQAGDRTGTGQFGPGYTIPDEIDENLSHDRAGTLSMANRGPDTGGSQFFITERPLPRLDGRHTVFGRCRNLDVIRRIARTPAGPNNHPETPVTIETIELERDTFKAPTDVDDAG